MIEGNCALRAFRTYDITLEVDFEYSADSEPVISLKSLSNSQ
jgi:hypothetical protein